MNAVGKRVWWLWALILAVLAVPDQALGGSLTSRPELGVTTSAVDAVVSRNPEREQVWLRQRYVSAGDSLLWLVPVPAGSKVRWGAPKFITQVSRGMESVIAVGETAVKANDGRCIQPGTQSRPADPTLGPLAAVEGVVLLSSQAELTSALAGWSWPALPTWQKVATNKLFSAGDQILALRLSGPSGPAHTPSLRFSLPAGRAYPWGLVSARAGAPVVLNLVTISSQRLLAEQHSVPLPRDGYVWTSDSQTNLEAEAALFGRPSGPQYWRALVLSSQSGVVARYESVTKLVSLPPLLDEVLLNPADATACQKQRDQARAELIGAWNQQVAVVAGCSSTPIVGGAEACDEAKQGPLAQSLSCSPEGADLGAALAGLRSSPVVSKLRVEVTVGLDLEAFALVPASDAEDVARNKSASNGPCKTPGGGEGASGAGGSGIGGGNQGSSHPGVIPPPVIVGPDPGPIDNSSGACSGSTVSGPDDGERTGSAPPSDDSCSGDSSDSGEEDSCSGDTSDDGGDDSCSGDSSDDGGDDSCSGDSSDDGGDSCSGDSSDDSCSGGSDSGDSDCHLGRSRRRRPVPLSPAVLGLSVVAFIVRRLGRDVGQRG